MRRFLGIFVVVFGLVFLSLIPTNGYCSDDSDNREAIVERIKSFTDQARDTDVRRYKKILFKSAVNDMNHLLRMYTVENGLHDSIRLTFDYVRVAEDSGYPLISVHRSDDPKGEMLARQVTGALENKGLAVTQGVVFDGQSGEYDESGLGDDGDSDDGGWMCTPTLDDLYELCGPPLRMPIDVDPPEEESCFCEEVGGVIMKCCKFILDTPIVPGGPSINGTIDIIVDVAGFFWG